MRDFQRLEVFETVTSCPESIKSVFFIWLPCWLTGILVCFPSQAFSWDRTKYNNS